MPSSYLPQKTAMRRAHHSRRRNGGGTQGRSDRRRRSSRARQEQVREKRAQANTRKTGSVPQEKKIGGPIFYVALALALAKDLLGIIALLMGMIFTPIVIGVMTAPIGFLVGVALWFLFWAMGVKGGTRQVVTRGMAIMLECIPIVKVFFWYTFLVIGTRIYANHGIKKRNKKSSAIKKAGKVRRVAKVAGKVARKATIKV